MNVEDLFLSQLPLIERVTESLCRRHSVYGAEAEDFDSAVKVKLIANDYAVLRRFQGRSRFETYLTTIIRNAYRDYQDHKWGKWRSSIAAKSLGDEARRLETLISRDGWPVDQAIEIMCRNEDVASSRKELKELAERLPARAPKRRIEGEDKLPEVPSLLETDSSILDKERAEAMQKAEAALKRALTELDDQDRLVLRMCYWDGFKVSRVAVLLGLQQRSLYTRLNNLLRILKARLQQEGISQEEISALLKEPPP